MARQFNPEEYQPVDERLKLFRERFPEGRVLTELFYHDDRTFIFRAVVYPNPSDTVLAVGFAGETVGEGGPVNRTNALENAETSAVGRALANTGFPELSPKGRRPSREEMEKAAAAAAAAKPAAKSDAKSDAKPAAGAAEKRVNKAKANLVAALRERPYIKDGKGWTPKVLRDVAAQGWGQAVTELGYEPGDVTELDDSTLQIVVAKAGEIVDELARNRADAVDGQG